MQLLFLLRWGRMSLALWFTIATDSFVGFKISQLGQINSMKTPPSTEVSISGDDALVDLLCFTLIQRHPSTSRPLLSRVQCTPSTHRLHVLLVYQSASCVMVNTELGMSAIIVFACQSVWSEGVKEAEAKHQQEKRGSRTGCHHHHDHQQQPPATPN